MARTTIAEVRLVFTDGLVNVEDATITSFITDANVYVTQILGSSGLPTTILTAIEKYITAHFIAMTIIRQAQKEEVKDAKIEYTGKTGTALEATFYGQMALTLDSSGLLKKSANTKSVTLFAVETDDTSWGADVS